MKRLTISKSVLLPAAIVAFVVVHGELLHAQSKILFLRLSIQNDSIALVRSSIRPGVLKQGEGSGRGSGIEYQCRSASGQIVATGIIADPSIRHYEYEDPEHPGILKTTHVKLKSAQFTLRLALKENLSRVEFYRVASDPNAGVLPKATRTFLGTIEIHPERGVQ